MSKITPNSANLTSTLTKQGKTTDDTKIDPQEKYALELENILGILNPFVGLISYIMILFVVLNWPVIKYSIQILSVLGIWTLNCLIQPTGTDLMSVYHHKRWVDYYHILR